MGALLKDYINELQTSLSQTNKKKTFIVILQEGIRFTLMELKKAKQHWLI